MKASKRDANRTQNKFLLLAAAQQKRAGMTEERFVSQFTDDFQPLARKMFRLVK